MRSALLWQSVGLFHPIRLRRAATIALAPLLMLFLTWTAGPGSVANAADRFLDYYEPAEYSSGLLSNVEKYHLEPARSALRNEDWASARNNLAFMLRYFPNHPIVLQLADEYSYLSGDAQFAKKWFEEALSRYPEHAQTHVVYGIYLHRRERYKDAVEEYRRAIELEPDQATNAYYNLGLALVKLGQLNEARQAAKEAYALGHPLPGLRHQLQDAGAWESE